MTTEFELPDLCAEVHANLALLCIPPHSPSNMILAALAPNVPWQFEPDYQNSLIKFSSPVTQRVGVAEFVEAAMLAWVVIGGTVEAIRPEMEKKKETRAKKHKIREGYNFVRKSTFGG